MAQAKIGRGVHITFLGHSAFKLSGDGVNVLIYPWLSNPLLNTPVEKVGPVDLILVTHGHGDHVGETVAVAQASHAPVVAIHELSVILARQGAPEVIGMNKGGTLAIAGCKITMTHAVHSSAVEEGGELIAAGDLPASLSSLATASWPTTPATPRSSRTWSSSRNSITRSWPCSPSAAITS